ncbi:unnamed protein product, partial [Notodromas monacha]
YTVNYREAGSNVDWEEIRLDATSNTYVLRDLKCGTKYEVFLTAFNQIGTGLPSEVVFAQTSGSVPYSPDKSHLLVINTTSAILKLDAFEDGGCPIINHVISYKRRDSSGWLNFPSETVVSDVKRYKLENLSPATTYELKISSTMGRPCRLKLRVKSCNCLLPPQHGGNRRLVLGFRRVRPLLRKPEFLAEGHLMDSQGRPCRENSYGLSFDYPKHIQKPPPGYSDVNPYATFQLALPNQQQQPQQPPQRDLSFGSSYFGNEYNGNNSYQQSARAEFVYFDPKAANMETYPLRHEHNLVKSGTSNCVMQAGGLGSSRDYDAMSAASDSDLESKRGRYNKCASMDRRNKRSSSSKAQSSSFRIASGLGQQHSPIYAAASHEISELEAEMVHSNDDVELDARIRTLRAQHDLAVKSLTKGLYSSQPHPHPGNQQQQPRASRDSGFPIDWEKGNSPGVINILYRLVFACHCLAWLIVDFKQWGIRYSIIYFTIWSFILIMVDSFLKAGLTLWYTFGEMESEAELTFAMKISWLLTNVTHASAIIVTATYWPLIYDDSVIEGTNFVVHGTNSIYVLSEIFLNRRPVLMGHVIYPMMYFIVFLVFSLVYYLCGGTDAAGNPYIYISWEKTAAPGTINIAYRTAVAVHNVTWLALLFYQWGFRYAIIYFTVWSFILITVDSVIKAMNSFGVFFFKDEADLTDYSPKLPILMKISWLLTSVSHCCSLFVTLAFWLFLYTGNFEFNVSFVVHTFNSVYVLLEVFFNRLPVYIGHVIYALIYFFLYGCFSLVYYLRGGTDAQVSDGSLSTVRRQQPLSSFTQSARDNKCLHTLRESDQYGKQNRSHFLSLAIVAMVNYTAIPHAEGPRTSESCDFNANKNASQETEANDIKIENQGTLIWDESIQQLTISAFYWGYLVLQVPGGRWAEMHGAKRLISISMLVSAFCTFLVPICAQSGYILLMLNRAVMGIAQMHQKSQPRKTAQHP